MVFLNRKKVKIWVSKMPPRLCGEIASISLFRASFLLDLGEAICPDFIVTQKKASNIDVACNFQVRLNVHTETDKLTKMKAERVIYFLNLVLTAHKRVHSPS